MFHSSMFKSKQTQVTVEFRDGWHSFPLSSGTTLTELADRIDALGAVHAGAPISIDIEFTTPRAPLREQSHRSFPVTH